MADIDKKMTDRTRRRYNRIAPWFDREGGSQGMSGPWRAALWAQVPAERVLEVGVGAGTNMPYYPKGALVTGIDLSDQMLGRARQRAASLGAPVELQEGDVQALTFPDASFDSAVATFVFCSVPDPILGLAELKRVVKPGGRILLLEHVRIDRPVIGALMDLLNPLVVSLVGANINRRTVENVKRADLVVEQVTDLGPMGMVKLIVARPGVGQRD